MCKYNISQYELSEPEREKIYMKFQKNKQSFMAGVMGVNSWKKFIWGSLKEWVDVGKPVVASRKGIAGRGIRRSQNIEIRKCTVYLEVGGSEKVEFERKYKIPQVAD